MRNIIAQEKYSEGEVIFKEGSFGEATYMILSGEVIISVTVRGSRIKFGKLKRGDILGQISLVDKQARSATAVAVGDVELGIIDKDFLENEINKTSRDFRLILNAMSDRLRETTNQLIGMTSKYQSLKSRVEQCNNQI